MRRSCAKFGLMFLLSTVATVAQAGDFQGAKATPIGVTDDQVTQLQIQFPEQILKKDAFDVNCSPAVGGFSSWADNNTAWTYDFKVLGQQDTPHLVGGAKCTVTQTQDVAGVDGKVWKAGTLNYSVIVNGPKVAQVYPANGFDGSLRESDPVMLIVFDGPLDRSKFFSEGNGYLSYASPNAPAEKMQLTMVPADQEKTIFDLFDYNNYLNGAKYEDKTWVLATVKQTLIAGSSVALHIEGVTSGANPDVKSTEKFTATYEVRGKFEVNVTCQDPAAKGANCLPDAGVDVALSSAVKWPDVKGAYIEYVPFKSKDGKTVRTYPTAPSQPDDSTFNRVVNAVAQYVPMVATFSDTLVTSISFDIKAEPLKQAKIVLPSGLQDIDGRKLESEHPYFVRFGAMEEQLQTPKAISFFEKKYPKLLMPVGVVNQNQTLYIRKSGNVADQWAPITDVASMIRLIRAYDDRGDYRKDVRYVSPMETLNQPSTEVKMPLTGQRNRVNVLQFPFSKAQQQQPTSGMYAIEVSSPTYEQSQSSEGMYFNPRYVLAQVTDLAVHLKKGTTQTVAWVTHLSDAQPVPGAEVTVYNCLGAPIQTVMTDASGLAVVSNDTKTANCAGDKGSYSPYSTATEFFVVARAQGDQALTHTTWTSPADDVLSAPGVEYFYSDISEGTPHFHAVIGVNLVKPGQTVPIELVAKLPNAKGFAEVSAQDLPSKARVINSDDTDIFYEFPLKWSGGTAQIQWNVPADSSVKLGLYTIELSGMARRRADMGDAIQVNNGDIEVAEFKVPLMSGVIAFPAQPLVQPDSIPVNTVIRYANGVGAKSLAADMSYYFEPTAFHRDELTDFNFGTGQVRLNDQDQGADTTLPNSSRPAQIQGLSTDDQGALVRDIAQEKIYDGRTVAAVLKTLDRPQTLVVRVRYQDQMGEYQTLSQAKDIFNSNLYVGTSLVEGARQDAKLKAAAMSVDGKNVTDINDLDLKVVRVDTKVIGEELFGGMIKNTIERELHDVRWQGACVPSQQVVSCSVGDLKEGTYAFQVTSKSTQQAANVIFKVDSDGRVYGDGDYYNYGDDNGGKALPLALDKKSYKDGDTATVSFPAPFKTCLALVSLERGDVISAWVVNDACQKGAVQVPVDASEAPNVFVSVYTVTGRAKAPQRQRQVGETDMGRPTYRLGFANVKIDWARFKANVAVKTDKPVYQPGDTVNVQVQVSADQGRLTNGTAIVIALEEKILELKKNDTYNLLDALMQLRTDNVTTITPLERIETYSGGNYDMPGRKGGDEGGDGSDKSEFKRKLFDALVHFEAVPVVNGVAQVSFKANDSLTKFKVIAVAIDGGQKFGTGDTEYLSEKDTQSYSNIPSVAYSGDTYPVKVTVQNNSGKDQKYRTEVTATVRDANGNVIQTKTLSQSATVTKSGSNAIDVGALTVSDDAATITYDINVYDEAGNLVDSMQPSAQVVLPAVPLAIHDSFLVQVQGGQLMQSLTKDVAALVNKGEIRATLASSLVDGAIEQVRKRVAQDRFADFFIESQIYAALIKDSQQNSGDVKAALQKLLSYLDSNGFVKYYAQESNGSLYLTANILNALAAEPWSIKVMPRALSDKLQGAISQVLTKSVDPSYVGKTDMDWLRAQTAMGRAAYAFNDQSLKDSAANVAALAREALAKNPKTFGAPIEKWSNDDLLSLWLLEVAAAPDQALNSPIYTQLTAPSRLVKTGNMASFTGGPSYGWFYSDDTVQAAQLLDGYARVKGPDALARALAAGLVNNSHDKWYVMSTLINVTRGLKSFGRAYESEPVSGTAILSVVELNQSTPVDWSTGITSKELRTPWATAKATVQVAQSGKGQPWLGVQALTAVPLKQATAQGISIDKSIRNVTRSQGYQAGDVIEVTLNLNTVANINHVAVNDPIPAGANIVGDAYGDFSSGEKSYSGYKLYFEYMATGTTTVKYQYQLNNPGTFNLPPTRAEGLYLPSVFGEVPNATMTIQ